jgi:gluconate 2-dehydrogenase gamma chain
MSDEKTDITRREAIKSITIGAGVIASLPVLNNLARGDERKTDGEHMHHAAESSQEPAAPPYKLKFFTADENVILIALSERIIPADDHSAGAKEARVSEYIDVVVSASPDSVQQSWRRGIGSVEKKCQEMFSKRIADTTAEEQDKLLTEIGKRELAPSNDEERFFRMLKMSTIDGYYTSKIGIHDELHYKGNAYLKEFVGCTHPEHLA